VAPARAAQWQFSGIAVAKAVVMAPGRVALWQFYGFARAWAVMVAPARAAQWQFNGIAGAGAVVMAPEGQLSGIFFCAPLGGNLQHCQTGERVTATGDDPGLTSSSAPCMWAGTMDQQRPEDKPGNML